MPPNRLNILLGMIVALLSVLVILFGVFLWKMQPGSVTPSMRSAYDPEIRTPVSPIEPQQAVQPVQPVQPAYQPTVTPVADPFADKNAASKYLIYLAQVENYRLSVQRQQQSEGLAEETRLQRETFNPNPSPMAPLGNHSKVWEQMISSFNSQICPESCATLKTRYGALLEAVRSLLAQTEEAVQMSKEGQSAEAMDKLLALQKQGTGNLQMMAGQTDEALSNVCTQYGLSKTFTIK